MPTVQTSIQTADAEVKSGEGRVYWVSASAAATGGAWQLDDGDGSGTIRLSAVTGANTSVHYDFTLAPLTFNTAIFADIQGTNVTLTVGFT